ncbi:hypothetical protein DINM_020560 [Dirofilaria immitis]|nr:hypothetical protein [Dirofilaria immitis]
MDLLDFLMDLWKFSSEKFWKYSNDAFWLLTSCIFPNVICLPDFVSTLPKVKKVEYDKLYEQQQELTRAEFYDLCQNWAENQGAKIKRDYRVYRLAEERYIEKRDQRCSKEFLYELLDLQKNMDITLKMYEAAEEEMRNSISITMLREATKVWNSLNPAYID